MTDKELYQQMLHFIECSGYRAESIKKELKIRLAQPDADAVAWVDEITLRDLKNGKEGVHLVYELEMVNASIPLFEYPPEKEWVGLTDEEIKNSMQGHNTQVDFARAIEAKLKEKNSD